MVLLLVLPQDLQDKREIQQLEFIALSWLSQGFCIFLFLFLFLEMGLQVNNTLEINSKQFFSPIFFTISGAISVIHHYLFSVSSFLGNICFSYL